MFQVRCRAHTVHLSCPLHLHRRLGWDLACGMQRKYRRGDRDRRSMHIVGHAALELERRRLAIPRKLVERFRPAHLLRLEETDGRRRGGCPEIDVRR